MKNSYSIRDLLRLKLPCLPETAQNIHARAKRENWPHRWGKQQGGPAKKYLAHLLPKSIQKAIVIVEDAGALFPSSHNPPVNNESITENQQKKATMKAALTGLYLRASRGAIWGKRKQARDLFIDAYNSGVDYRDIYDVLGQQNVGTIEGWILKLKKNHNNTLALADHRGAHKKGRRKINPIQAQILIAVVRQPKGIRPKSDIITETRSRLIMKGLEPGPSDATFRRFLDDWIAVNYDEWIFWQQGEKGLEDKCLFWVERDYNLIEVGDVVVADGHVLNFRTIDPWTGKSKRMMLVLFYDMKSNMPLGWEILPTENTQAISSALRRAILRLGKIPKIVYLDNGRAFKGHYFMGVDFEQTELPGLYERLGIRLIVAKPYHGQSKTIERFFETFAKLERQAPSYTGTSIELKPPHLSRNEKLHKRIHNKITQGDVPTLIETHRAVALWFDWYAGQPQSKSSHMAGQCPQDLFEAGKGPGVDPVLLRHLMMKKEIKTIHRRGIKLVTRGEWYYHTALYGRKHKVVVLYDLQAGDSVLIYDHRNNKFICEATIFNKVHPAALILGSDADKAELKGQLEMQGSLKKKTMSYARSFVESEVIPDARRQIEASEFKESKSDKIRQLVEPEKPRKLTKAEILHIKTEFEKRTRAAEAERASKDVEKEEKHVPTVEDPAAVLRRELEQLEDIPRYEKLIELDVRGHLIPKKWLAWMQFFELGAVYERYKDYYADYRTKMAMFHQVRETKK